MKDAFKRMLESMKFWTMVIGLFTTAGATWLAKKGIEVSDETAMQIAITISGLFAILLHAQGQADLGKNAPPTVNAPSSTAIAAPAAPTSVPPQAVGEFDAGAQKGHVNFRVALGIAIVGAVVILLAACPKGITPDGVKSDVVDCTKNEISGLTKQFGPLVDSLIIAGLDQSTGKLNWDPIKTATKDFAQDTGMCVLASSVQRVLRAGKPGASLSPLKVDEASIMSGFDAVRSEKAPGKKFKTAEGAL